MSRKTQQARYRGFFSLDAASAILIAAFAYASFALILSAAASGASSGATGVSSRLLSLRLSSLLLDETGAETGGAGAGAYSKSGELDLSRLGGQGLQGFLLGTGRRFAGVSVFSRDGKIFSSSAGSAGGGEVFCTSRLALLSGKAVRMEACIS